MKKFIVSIITLIVIIGCAFLIAFNTKPKENKSLTKITVADTTLTSRTYMFFSNYRNIPFR